MDWWAFALIVWVSLVVPGPDFVVIAQAALSGIGPGLRTAAGVVTGLCLHGALAAAGLGAVLASSPELMEPVRVVGGCVLVWFGARLLRSPQAAEGDGESAPVGSGRCFVRGLAVNAFNPKALLFFVAVLPQFVTAAGPVSVQVAVLGVTVVGSAVLWWTLVVTAIRLARFPRGGAAEIVATRVGGATLVVLGVVLGAQAL